jgi:hypothetical protein
MSRTDSGNPLGDFGPNVVNSYPYFDVHSQILCIVLCVKVYICNKYSPSFYAGMSTNTYIMKYSPYYFVANTAFTKFV